MVKTSGLDVAVTWRAGAHLPADRGELRMAMEFGGARPEDVRLHAVYLRAQ